MLLVTCISPVSVPSKLSPAPVFPSKVQFIAKSLAPTSLLKFAPWDPLSTHRQLISRPPRAFVIPTPVFPSASQNAQVSLLLKSAKPLVPQERAEQYFAAPGTDSPVAPQ